MDVRLGSPSDAAAIRAVLEAAFPTAAEAALVDELRRAGDVVFSLAADGGVRIVGCVVFSKMVAPFPARALGPVAVLLERQRGGVGSLLIRPPIAAASDFSRTARAGSNRPTSARISWRWRWGGASGRRTSASWDMPTPSRWDSSTRAPKPCRNSRTYSQKRRNRMEIFQTPDAKTLGLPFSSAVRAGETLYLSGALGNLPGTMTLAPGGMAGQARQTMENIGMVLRYCGLDFADIAKCTVMLADMAEWAEFNKIYVTYFAPDRLPARSALGANGLALGAKVEVECIARYPEGTARVIPI
jgi:reactive intermediate/imine deaminase